MRDLVVLLIRVLAIQMLHVCQQFCSWEAIKTDYRSSTVHHRVTQMAVPIFVSPVCLPLLSIVRFVRFRKPGNNGNRKTHYMNTRYACCVNRWFICSALLTFVL